MIDTATVHGASVNTAVIVLFHGSRAGEAGEAVRRVISEVRRRGKYEIVEGAFLRHAEPGLMDVIQNCVQRHVGKIVIVPFFLQIGRHVTADIPALVEEVRKRYPGLRISMTDAVGSHPGMIDIVLDLARKGNC